MLTYYRISQIVQISAFENRKIKKLMLQLSIIIYTIPYIKALKLEDFIFLKKSVQSSNFLFGHISKVMTFLKKV